MARQSVKRATVYGRTGFGYRKDEVRDVQWRFKHHAQYPKAVEIICILKGRNRVSFTLPS